LKSGLVALFLLLGMVLCRPAHKPLAAAAAPEPAESTACVPLVVSQTPAAGLRRAGLSGAAQSLVTDNLARLGVTVQKCGANETLFLDWRGERLRRIEYHRRYDQTYVVLLDSGRTRLAGAYHYLRVEPKVYAGTIRSSLWGSMMRIGQKQDIIIHFADLFSWDVDFFTETQPGDSFKLISEQLYCDDRPIGLPQLIVGEYKGKIGEYYGLSYQDPTGHRDYYTQKGESVRKSFLRSPLSFKAVVTSPFSAARLHPILRYVRPHYGVDYGAHAGTPVSAIGDGVVVWCSWNDGYGNLVMINHRGGYQSRYAHLSRFGNIHQGGFVKQGTVIGYVGMTGEATGPHLHFEIRVNGVPKNPLTIIPPRAEPVAPRFMPQFRARSDSLVALLRAAGPTPQDMTAPPDTITNGDSE
jgi:murein DD-endopeptidase MepM/ murein hydrolase activator NlpD